jgi:hypothetical protein
MEKIASLQKIKWTVFLQVGEDSLSIFTQCVEKLVQSIDPKRTEVLYLGNQDPLYLQTFSHLCEKANVPYNYADDEKHALELSKGQFVLFLTDHTIIPRNLLVKLTYALEKSGLEGAVVAPTSNEIADDLGLTPFNLDAVQVNLSKQQIPYAYTMNLAMFCVMVKKSTIKEGQNIRELILQANFDGYLTISANDTIVFHYAEVIDEAISKDFVNPNPKLGVLYRIKIDDDYIRDVFVKSLQQSIKLDCNIYVLDDNSKVKVGIFLREKHPELWEKITKYDKFSRPYDEKRDYNELIEWAEKDECNWILSLEADEVLEDKVDHKYISRFIYPVNPQIFGYKVNHYHFWDSETKWRVDNPWGKMMDIRLSRLFPGKRITKEGMVAGQTGYVPMLPAECVRDSGIRIKNYGYTRAEARAQKKDFYEKLGMKTDNNQAPDFSYLTRENGMHRYDWIENNTVTFYTPTKTGGDILYRWLDTNAYFADEILVGNDSNQLSKEDVDLICDYNNAIVITNVVMGDNFAKGRNDIIKHATKDWIYQLDIDEYIADLCPLHRILDAPGYDAWMFSINNFQKDGGSMVSDTIRLFRNKPGVEYWGRLHETVDAYSSKNGWKISYSPIQMNHVGYTMQTAEEAYKKMQRYLDINLKQIKDNPTHGMAYYNLALHMLEDKLIDDAEKILQICTFFQPGFPLAGLELAKTYIIKANRWMNNSLRGFNDNHRLKRSFLPHQKALESIMPKNYLIAPGHCVQYFSTHAEEAKWLREHVVAMEKKIEEEKTKFMEKRAKSK